MYLLFPWGINKEMEGKLGSEGLKTDLAINATFQYLGRILSIWFPFLQCILLN